MRTEARRSFATSIDGGGISWTSLGLLTISVIWGICSWFALLGPYQLQSAAFTSAAGWFVILAIWFWHRYGSRGITWTNIPTLLTIEALLTFLAMPVLQFSTGSDVLDAQYGHAMFLALIGFTAFWIGCLLFKKGPRFRYSPQAPEASDRLAFMSGLLLGLGTAGKLILWKSGLYSYTADSVLRENSFEYTQWLTFLGSLLNAALVVSAIEVLGKLSTKPLMKIIFWLSLAISIGMGVISGMKGEILMPLLTIVLVYAITKGRIPRLAVLLPVFLVVFIAPFVTAYRKNLNQGYRAQVNTIEGLETVISKSANDALHIYSSTSADASSSGIELVKKRLSYLSSLRAVIGLTNPAFVNGDEKIWLAPVYPLVPRFLWRSKPVFNKGQRISIALGAGSQTSTAPTMIGDLFMLYGTWGVGIGMFVWGVCVQLYMNWIGRKGISELGLFIYISMVPLLLNLESDVIAFVGGLVQLGIFVVVISRIIYADPTWSQRVRTRHEIKLASMHKATSI